MKKQVIELNYPFTSPAFKAAWGALLEMPKWKNKPAHALQIALNKLEQYEEAFAISLIESAIIGGWQGLVYGSTDTEYAKWKEARKRQNTGIAARESEFKATMQKIDIRASESVPMPESVRKALLGG